MQFLQKGAFKLPWNFLQSYFYIQTEEQSVSNTSIMDHQLLRQKFIRELSQITFAFFVIFGPCTSPVYTLYVVNYTFFWPPTHPNCKRNLWKAPNDM